MEQLEQHGKTIYMQAWVDFLCSSDFETYINLHKSESSGLSNSLGQRSRTGFHGNPPCMKGIIPHSLDCDIHQPGGTCLPSPGAQHCFVSGRSSAEGGHHQSLAVANVAEPIRSELLASTSQLGLWTTWNMVQSEISWWKPAYACMNHRNYLSLAGIHIHFAQLKLNNKELHVSVPLGF